MQEEKEEFIRQMERYQGKLQNLLRSHFQDPEMRKDVFQDILMEAWKSYANFQGKASFGTWIYRIALNVIFLSYRKAERAPQVFNMDEQFDLAGEEKPQLSAQAEKLYRLIQSLPSVEKSILTAHLDGYKNHEIAEILGISKNHVAVKLHRIKETVKSKLVETHEIR